MKLSLRGIYGVGIRENETYNLGTLRKQSMKWSKKGKFVLGQASIPSLYKVEWIVEECWCGLWKLSLCKIEMA
jgi:hypothetical protein